MNKPVKRIVNDFLFVQYKDDSGKFNDGNPGFAPQRKLNLINQQFIL